MMRTQGIIPLIIADLVPENQEELVDVGLAECRRVKKCPMARDVQQYTNVCLGNSCSCKYSHTKMEPAESVDLAEAII